MSHGKHRDYYIQSFQSDISSTGELKGAKILTCGGGGAMAS